MHINTHTIHTINIICITTYNKDIMWVLIWRIIWRMRDCMGRMCAPYVKAYARAISNGARGAHFMASYHHVCCMVLYYFMALCLYVHFIISWHQMH
jgi:hypothetical protein